MGLITEVWTRPGDANFGRVIDGVPISEQTAHKAMTELGGGSFKVPNTFGRFDEILKIDEATPANSVSSLVRIYDPSDLTAPVFEWLPTALVPTESKTDLDIDVTGAGIKSIMDYARVEAYDWDGSDDWVPSIPDWIYGGGNVLSNPGFEQSPVVPKVFKITIDASAGTFTLSDGTDTTSAIAYNVAAGDLDNTIETDITAITDIAVTGAGPGVYLMEMVDPPFGVNLTLDDAGLTGTGAIETTQEGFIDPSPWTRAKAIVAGSPSNPGFYNAFEVSTVHAFDGVYSLKVDPGAVGLASNRNAGAQQVVSVNPGQTYQTKLYIYATSATDKFVLAVFGLGGEYIARTTLDGTTFTANTWSEFALPNVVIPDDVTQVIFRIFCIDSYPTDPSAFYIDAAEFKEGKAATTVGAIISDLFDDATVDHVADGRIVWEDLANPGNPYLSIDFDDSLDSNGDAWFEDAVSVRLWMRMTYRQVLDQFVQDYDVEWRIIPDDVEAGSWLLQIFNPGGMGTDYTSAQSPAIQGSASDVGRSIRRFMPSATNHLVEGEGRITARRDTVGLEAAVGRIEGSRLDRQLPVSVAQAAQQDATDTTSNATPYGYVLVAPQEAPLAAYDMGDVLTIHDPPEVDDAGRFIDVQIVDTPNSTIYEVQFFPTTPAGS